MKRREFLTATAVVAIPGAAAAAIAAPVAALPVIQEPEDKWEPTAYFGHMGRAIWQRWVNARTGDEDWRQMQSVDSLMAGLQTKPKGE